MMEQPRSLTEYLRDGFANGVVEFTIRQTEEYHAVIHPSGQDGDTLDIIFAGGSIITTHDSKYVQEMQNEMNKFRSNI